MFPYSAVNSSEISYDKEEETVTLSFPSPLPLGNGQLIMDFTGELNDKMKGFYRSKYTGTDGKEKYCAVTQFEVCTIYVLFDLNIIYTFNYYFNVAKCNLGKVRIKPMLVSCILRQACISKTLNGDIACLLFPPCADLQLSLWP